MSLSLAFHRPRPSLSSQNARKWLPWAWKKESWKHWAENTNRYQNPPIRSPEASAPSPYCLQNAGTPPWQREPQSYTCYSIGLQSWDLWVTWNSLHVKGDMWISVASPQHRRLELSASFHVQRLVVCQGLACNTHPIQEEEEQQPWDSTGPYLALRVDSNSSAYCSAWHTVGA